MAGKFRADHVGSLLRPPELLQARADLKEGRISQEQYRRVEDESVLKALELQRQAGLDVFTDGEYRRTIWYAPLSDAVEGLIQDPSPAIPAGGFRGGGWQGRGAELAAQAMQAVGGAGLVVSAKIRQVRRLSEDSRFVKRHAPGPWKITIPGVMMRVPGWFKPGLTDRFYATREDLINEFVGLVRGEIKALIDEGCSYFQLDSLLYVIYQGRMREGMQRFGQDPDRLLDETIAVDNATLAGFRGTPGLTIGLHMCRGNNRSAWATEGSYEACAERAFQQLDVDRFLLEYDTERAGGFEPLRFMPRDKMVVLGLISSKEPQLEPVDELRRRIDEAAKYVPIENLAISPQCGFASTDLGNLLTWDEQRRKLELIAEVARRVWG